MNTERGVTAFGASAVLAKVTRGPDRSPSLDALVITREGCVRRFRIWSHSGHSGHQGPPTHLQMH